MYDFFGQSPNPALAICDKALLKNLGQFKKIGHAGTLDPLATGLLILCVGKYTKKIDWEMLSQNPEAIELLKSNRGKIDWELLSRNTNDGALELLKANQKKIYWDELSRNTNPEAIELLKANPDEIDWEWLSGNTNPEAIELLKKIKKK